MKILSKPNLEWSEEATCQYCDAVLEIDSSDLFFEFGCKNDDLFYAWCPVCNHKLFTSNPIPKLLKIELVKKKECKNEQM